MDLKTRLDLDLKNALKTFDDLRKRTLRMVISNIRLTEIDRGIKLDDTGIISVLQKEIKSRRESILDAEKAGRPDLIQASQDEIKVLETYLPQGLSEAELKAAAIDVIAELDAKSPADMGKVMKTLLAKLQGRVPGDQVSKVVRELLQK